MFKDESGLLNNVHINEYHKFKLQILQTIFIRLLSQYFKTKFKHITQRKHTQMFKHGL